MNNGGNAGAGTLLPGREPVLTRGTTGDPTIDNCPAKLQGSDYHDYEYVTKATLDPAQEGTSTKCVNCKKPMFFRKEHYRNCIRCDQSLCRGCFSS